ncbi:hypothetical protein PRIC2_005950 [Phytophthora ramorum]
MNAHSRFALPINTHGNLKHLHDKAQAHDDGADKTDNQTSTSAAVSKPRCDSSSSKLSQKMKMLFLGKNTKAQPTPEEEAEMNERKRSTMSQLIGSHAFVQMGRR